jgi:hypothetical protein
VRFDQFAQMLVGPRTLGVVAELQHIFRGSRFVEVKFLARPVGYRSHRGCGRESPPFCLSAEVDFNGDMPAFVDMNVAVASQLKDFDRKRYIDRFVLVDAVLDFVRFEQRFFALPDEDQNIILAFFDDFEANQDVPENFARGRLDHPGLCTVTVNKKL